MKKYLALPSILLLAGMVVAQNQTVPPPTEQDIPAQSAPATTQSAPTAGIPAGTALMVRLETTLATFSNKPGDPFRGSLTKPVVINGNTIIPAGAVVEGRVTKVTEPRRISGKPTIGILPEALILPTGERFFLDATLVDTNIGQGTDVNEEGQFKGSGHDRRDQLEAGGGAAGGMLIGGLVGGPVGVVVGGAVGAGGTTAHWLSKHRSAIIPSGTELTLELNRALTMTPVVASAGSK